MLKCAEVPPPLEMIEKDHWVACRLYPSQAALRDADLSTGVPAPAGGIATANAGGDQHHA